MVLWISVCAIIWSFDAHTIALSLSIIGNWTYCFWLLAIVQRACDSCSYKVIEAYSVLRSTDYMDMDQLLSFLYIYLRYGVLRTDSVLCIDGWDVKK